MDSRDSDTAAAPTRTASLGSKMSVQEYPAAEKAHDIEVQAQQPAEPMLPPLEGRRAWLMATGGFLGLFATFVSHLNLSRCSFTSLILEQGFTNGSVASTREEPFPANYMFLQVLARIRVTIFNASIQTRPPFHS